MNGPRFEIILWFRVSERYDRVLVTQAVYVAMRSFSVVLSSNREQLGASRRLVKKASIEAFYDFQKTSGRSLKRFAPFIDSCCGIK